MLRPLLTLLAAVSPLVAQDLEGMEWNAWLRQRAQAGQDLIELRYRRDSQGLFEVASCQHGAIPFQTMFPDTVLPNPNRLRVAGFALLLALTQGGAGVLGSTDAERHLRRAGIDPSPIALRQFLVAPITNDDPVRRRVEVLDRVVAIDALLRAGHHGVVAELTALGKPGTPPLLAARATAALETLGRRPPTATRRRLDAASLPLPVAADGYLAIDFARLPDPGRLQAVARRFAIEQSHRHAEMLRAPTPDDLYHWQFIADLVGEMPFEIARRFGNVRIDHAVVAILAQAPGGKVPFGWNLQATGELEHDQLEATAAAIATQAPAECRCERREDAMLVTMPFGQLEFGPTSLRSHSAGMGGKPRPELAAALLAEGPAIRVLVPKASKLWLALAFLELPPAGSAELTVTPGDEFQACLLITARDEDAADAWAERLRKLQAAAGDELRASLPAYGEELQPLVDALAETRITTDGARVQAVLASRKLDLAPLPKLVQLLLSPH